MNNNNSGMFDDEDIMIFPESIDDIEPVKTSYMFTTTKLILMFVGILPLIIAFILILSEFGAIPALAFGTLYLIIYIYLVRLYVIEEPKQRESLNQLEDNKYSDYSFFWDITKVGTSKKDNGLLYLKQDGITLKRAYVVRFDSGSIVGVPEDFLDNYRHTQQAFLRSLGMSIKWYSIQKKPSMNQSLKYQSKNLKNIDNPELNKLIKMQLNTYLRYSVDADQRYVNYIVVINDKFETLSSFKQNLEDILNRTLRTNSSFKNVEILDKDGINEFFSTYYMQNNLDVTTIRKSSITKPFSSYAKIVNIVDSDGKAVPVEILDEINEQVYKLNQGMTVEKVFSDDDIQAENKEKIRLRQKERAKSETVILRRENKITFEEYKERMLKIEEEYSPENFILNKDKVEKERKKEQQKQERIAKREAIRKAKEEAERIANTPKPKWFEKDKVEDNNNDVIYLSDDKVKEQDIVGDNIDTLLYDDEHIPNIKEDFDDNDVEEINIYDLLSDDSDEDDNRE